MKICGFQPSRISRTNSKMVLSPGLPWDWGFDISAINAMSRRDKTIVAWHEVPGKAPPKEPSRRVRYDRAQRIPDGISRRHVRRISVSVFAFEISSLQSSNRCPHLHESHRTLRDGSFGWRFPRHFVPGYDRTVPPGRVLAILPLRFAHPTKIRCSATTTVTDLGHKF